MVLPVMTIILLSIGTVLLILWFIFLAASKEFNELLQPLDKKQFILRDLYGIGFKILKIINYQYKTKADRKLRQEINVLYGEKYAEYYIRIIYAQKITFAFSVLIIAFSLYGIANDIKAFLVGCMFSGLAYYYYGTVTSKKILKRSDEILRDFPEVVSKLALLTNAGMIIKEAWEKVAYDGEGIIYTEMQNVVQDLNNGISEVEAYYRFGARCVIPEIKKFTSTIIQGMTKGNQELVFVLKQQSKEVWEIKKHYVRQQGAKAASKLLIPICIMFVGILVMIIVPIFANLNAG